MTRDDSHNNYLTHKWETSPCNPWDSRETDTYCATCGISDQGDPHEFDWLEYPACEDVGKSDPFGIDWSRACENCGEKPVVNLTGMCGPCTFGEAETAGGNW